VGEYQKSISYTNRLLHTIAHIYYWHHSISTMSLRHVSSLRGRSPRSRTDISTWKSTNYAPDVKFSLVSSVYYITPQLF